MEPVFILTAIAFLGTSSEETHTFVYLHEDSCVEMQVKLLNTVQEQNMVIGQEGNLFTNCTPARVGTEFFLTVDDVLYGVAEE